MSDYCLTEDGRVLDFAPFFAGGKVKELLDGSWKDAVEPVSFEDHWNAHPLSVEEVRRYSVNTGTPISEDMISESSNKREYAFSYYCVTEGGRVFDLSPMCEGNGLLELFDGSWVKPSVPVYGADLYEARSISKNDIRKYGLSPGTIK